MRLESELRKTFSKGSISWESIVKSATAVEWADWDSFGDKSTLIMNVIAEKAEHLRSLSKDQSKDISVLVRNAVSLTSKDQLPIARLVLLQLLHDGHLRGTTKEWLQQFSKPTPIEKFLENYIRGSFRPNKMIFTELLELVKNADSIENCIKNFLFCFGNLPSNSSTLLAVIKRQRILKSISVKSLFSVLQELYKSQSLVSDLDLKNLLKLPKIWRTYILADEGLVRSYLSPSLRKKIFQDPYCIRENPSSIIEEKTLTQLKTELKGQEVNLETIGLIINTKGLIERADKSFNWSVLEGKTNAACVGPQSSSYKIWFEILKHKIEIPSAANIFLLCLVWVSVRSHDTRPYNDLSELSQCIKYASSEAVSFCVRNTRGKIQSDVITVIKGDSSGKYTNQDVVDWFFSGNLDDETDIETLLSAMPMVAENRKKSIFSIAVTKEPIALSLLEHSKEFQSFYLSRLSRVKIPEYVVSDNSFRVYGKLEAFGGEIIEAILARLNKLTPSVKAGALFQKTISFAPGAVPTVFSKRGIVSRHFAELLSSKEFENLSKDAQLGIFELRTPSGKLAFREALRKEEIEPHALGRIERFSHLRKYLIQYRPSSLTTGKASKEEYLAALIYTPGDSDKVAEAYTKDDLLVALPQALKLLEGRSRVSAALELAVRSQLTALPIFLQLVKNLAPPFKLSDLGRRFDNLYTTYELPKKSRGSRTISAPAPHLKLAQRGLLTLLYEEQFSDAATGFLPGKSIFDNASRHLGKNIVVNADIRGFFPSTTYKQVYSVARRLAGGKLSPLAARLFAEICCHNGHLATGAPSSPAVSNLILKPLDDILMKISEKLSVSYSRYADDVTFSGDSAAVWMLKPLEYHLERLGYELDPKKTNIFRKGRRQTVTGAVVNEKVTLARGLRKKLRAAVHRRVNGGEPTMHGKPLSDHALKGYLAYLSMLSPEHAKPYLAKLENLEEWHP